MLLQPNAYRAEYSPGARPTNDISIEFEIGKKIEVL